MKNKKLFHKIYILLLIICIISLLVLFVLGKINRICYLTELAFDENHINKTLEINHLNVDNIKQLFINTNNVVDNNALTNYIFTNETITNYSYGFRIKYYSKIFKHGDIYGVYPNISKILEDNSYIKEIKMENGGSPFGNLISQRKIYDEKIDNINYKLKLKSKFIITIIVVLLAILLIYYLMYFVIINKLKIISFFNKNIIYFFNDLKKFFLEKKKVIFKVYIITLIFFSVLTIILYFIGRIYQQADITNLQLIAESPAGYVYKANIIPKGFLAPNFIYKYSNSPLKVDNKPNYIKNYGYALEINRIPDWYNKDDKNIIYSNKTDSFTIYAPYDYNWNAYTNMIKVSVGEKYNITSEIKGSMSNNSFFRSVFISLDDYNKDIAILPTNKNILVYDTELSMNQYMPYSNQIEIYDMPYSKNDYGITILFPGNSELDIKYIKIEQVGGLYIKDNQYIVFTTDRKIDDFVNIYYNLSINNYIILIFLILLFPCLIFLLNRISLNNFQFSILSFILVTLLAIFHYWLCYPGNFHNWDVWGSMIEGVRNVYINWSPAIMSFTLHILYKLFGYDTHYLFTINILLFYIGLYILIISIYYKIKNIYVLILLLIPFIPHFFFVGIINQQKDFGASNFIWLSYILIFCWCISDIKSKKINFFIIFLFSLFLIMGMLWRHNFIALIYPIFILFTYKILKMFNIKSKIKYFLNFIGIMFVFAVLLVSMYISFPYIINGINGNKYKSAEPSNCIKFLQIASCAVPNNDDSMIPKEWYMEGKTFEDLKNTFNKNPYTSDIFLFLQQDIDPFYDRDLKDVSKVMFKYILKYPITYLKYKYEYLKLCWNVPNYDKANVYYIQYHLFKHNVSYEKYLHGYFDNSPSGITFNNLRGKIYSNLYKLIPEISAFYYIILSIIIFLISSILFIFKSNFRNNILMFTFCVSASALAINFIVVLYSTVALYRFMYPIIPLSVISLISFIIFIIDNKNKYRKKIKS